MITTEQLFAEPFEPLWMKWQCNAIEQGEAEREARLLRHYTHRHGKEVDPIIDK